MRYNFLKAPADENMYGMDPKRESRLKTLHKTAAFLHSFQFLLIFVFIATNYLEGTGVVQITQQITKWGAPNSTDTTGAKSIGGNFTLTLVQLKMFWADIKVIIAVFFLLAAADHWFVLFSQTDMGGMYLDSWGLPRLPLAETGAYARMIEYSVSASLMAVAIAIETGITDLTSLSGIFFLMWCCMIFGLLAEYLIQDDKPKWAWVAHFSGWIPFIAAYSPIFVAYDRAGVESASKAPAFVTGIVAAEFSTFLLFGFAQLLYLRYKNMEPRLWGTFHSYAPDRFADETWSPKIARYLSEMMFLLLSIISKTVLAWTVLGPVLMAKRS